MSTIDKRLVADRDFTMVCEYGTGIYCKCGRFVAVPLEALEGLLRSLHVRVHCLTQPSRDSLGGEMPAGLFQMEPEDELLELVPLSLAFGLETSLELGLSDGVLLASDRLCLDPTFP